MTYTIWSNGGKWEWLIRNGETVAARSGLIFNSRAAAKRAMLKANLPARTVIAGCDESYATVLVTDQTQLRAIAAIMVDQ